MNIQGPSLWALAGSLVSPQVAWAGCLEGAGSSWGFLDTLDVQRKHPAAAVVWLGPLSLGRDNP